MNVNPSSTPSDTADRSRSGRRRPEALVADDNRTILDHLALLVTSWGYAVKTASGGDEALRQAELLPDLALVITDLVMPGGEGIELIQSLRRHHPRAKIVAISGGGTFGTSGLYLESAELLGADCVLAKPFSDETLEAVVTKLQALPIA